MLVQCFMIQGSLKQLRRGDAKTSFQRRGKTKFQGDGLICCISHSSRVRELTATLRVADLGPVPHHLPVCLVLLSEVRKFVAG